MYSCYAPRSLFAKTCGTPNTTYLGHIAGPVHTGSGDINFDTFSFGSAISTKDEFLAALRTFKEELNVAHQQGLLTYLEDVDGGVLGLTPYGLVGRMHP